MLAVGFAFLFVPIQTLAYSDLPPGKSNNASALINLMRNLGGSVGISVGTTLLARRSQIHQDRLVSNLTNTAFAFQSHLQHLTHRFITAGVAPNDAARRALAVVNREVQTQAAMLAYLDTFIVLVIACLIAAALTSLLKTIDLKKGCGRRMKRTCFLSASLALLSVMLKQQRSVRIILPKPNPLPGFGELNFHQPA